MIKPVKLNVAVKGVEWRYHIDEELDFTIVGINTDTAAVVFFENRFRPTNANMSKTRSKSRRLTCLEVF